MKVCSKCKVERSTTDFYWRDKKKGRLHAQCKACYKENRLINQRAHYEMYRDSYRQRAIKYRSMLRKEYREGIVKFLLQHPCKECGESDLRVLELDHIDPSTKLFSISQAVRLGHRWPKVEEELQKCHVLCANCHKKRTATQFGWYKINGGT